MLLLLWGQSALYTVDQAEFGYVTRFGDPTVTHDGATDAGLHVKLPWPIDSVQRIDRRLQVVRPAADRVAHPRPPGPDRGQDDRGGRLRLLASAGRGRRRPVHPHRRHAGTGAAGC